MTGDPRRADAALRTNARESESRPRPGGPAARAPARINVVLPVFNESAAIRDTMLKVATFAGEHAQYRFLFVDDGSSDGTPDIIESQLHAAALGERLTLIRSSANTGKGYAVLLGVNAAIGDDDDLVLFTDGDLAYSLDHLPRLVDALRGADVAIGCRHSPQGGYRATPVRTAMGWTYNRLARVCLGSPYRDTQAGLKGFRLRAARELFASMRTVGFGFDVELLYLAQRAGLRIAQIPATVSPSHQKRGSSVSLWRDPCRMLVGLAGVRLSATRGQYARRETGRWPLALLSFDAEEFDLPDELGKPIPRDTQFAVARDGMRRVLDLLNDVPARATIFVTAAFAEACPDLVRECVSSGHEIASHGASHSSFENRDLLDSRRRIEAVAGVPVRGFRRPRMMPTDPRRIRDAGYTYDSSINPTLIPGRYNALSSPRTAFQDAGLVRIPLSTTPWLRFPLFWLAFKNLPSRLYRTATRWTLGADGYTALYFHPWEFTDLRRFQLPRHIARIDGDELAARLTRYLRWLSRRADFITYADAAARFRAREWPFQSSPASPGKSPVPPRLPEAVFPGPDIRVFLPSTDRSPGAMDPVRGR